MKNQLALVALLGLSTLVVPTPDAFAQQGEPLLKQGNKELGFSGNAVIDSDSELNLDVTYGYFVRDAWEVGVTVGSSLKKDDFSLEGGLFTEYNFNHRGRWVPFVGASTRVGTVDLKDDRFNADENLTSWVVGVSGGVKYFLRPHIAITGAVGFDYAFGDNFFGTVNDFADAAIDVNFGLRVYFD